MAKNAFLATLIVFLVAFGGPSLATDEERVVRDAVEVAQELFVSDDFYDQIAGAGTLVDIGDKESLQFLTDFMDHDDWSLMRAAIDMMLSVQHPAGVDLIYRLASIRTTGVFMKFLVESIASKPREDMAEFRGDHRVFLLRCHDTIVVGGSLEEVVFTSFTLEENAEMQYRAASLGELDPMRPHEVEKIRSSSGQEIRWKKFWDYHAGLLESGDPA